MLSSFLLAASILLGRPDILASVHAQELHEQTKIHTADSLLADRIPLATRALWIRRANEALRDLVSPCPFAAFGSAIVNHTESKGPGDLICIGANHIGQTGNPSLHGEIAAINNCTGILTDPNGAYRLSADEALLAFRDLTLYTNAEPCPMCASAIRYGGFRECVFGTTLRTLIDFGWAEIDIPAREVFARSQLVEPGTRLLQGVLANETDPYFAWQYSNAACPGDCSRAKRSGRCIPQG